jgi:hypothetical protein
MCKMHSRNFKTPKKKKDMKRHRKKWRTQRGLQQSPKLNKGNYKKRDKWIKDDSTKYKRGVEQRYRKISEKRIKQKSWK